MTKLVIILCGLFIIGVFVVGVHDAYNKGKTERSKTQVQELLEEQGFNNLASKQLALEQVLNTLQHNRPWILRPLTSFAQSPLCVRLGQALSVADERDQQSLADVLYNLSVELGCAKT